MTLPQKLPRSERGARRSNEDRPRSASSGCALFRNNPLMTSLGKWVAVVAALGLSLVPGCDDTEVTSTGPLLVVQAAEQQPGTDELGIIVVIQSWGGAWLEVEVSGGALADGKRAVCLRAPSATLLRDSRQEVLVFPDLVESVVTVRLLPNEPPVPEGGAGVGETTSGPVALGPCRIDAQELRQVIKPIRRIAPAPAPNGGSGGVAGSGGAAGGGGGSAGSTVGGAGGEGGNGGSGGQAEGGAGGSAIGGAADGGQSGAVGAGGEQ